MRAGARVKRSLEIIDFVIMSWSFESFYEIGDNFFLWQ